MSKMAGEVIGVGLILIPYFVQKKDRKYIITAMVTAASREIRRRLLLGRKVMMNLDSVLKSRDITLRTKVSTVKVMVFPVVMQRCESWIIKKAERQRTDACKLWRQRRLLKVPQTARRSNQSIPRKINQNIHWKDTC